MPASRKSRRGMAMKRRLVQSPRDAFMTEVANALPRARVGSGTAWEAGRRSIELSMEADRWLDAHGYDRGGRPLDRQSA